MFLSGAMDDSKSFYTAMDIKLSQQKINWATDL